jgi:hypothetical protein
MTNKELLETESMKDLTKVSLDIMGIAMNYLGLLWKDDHNLTPDSLDGFLD